MLKHHGYFIIFAANFPHLFLSKLTATQYATHWAAGEDDRLRAPDYQNKMENMYRPR